MVVCENTLDVTETEFWVKNDKKSVLVWYLSVYNTLSHLNYILKKKPTNIFSTKKGVDIILDKYDASLTNLAVKPSDDVLIYQPRFTVYIY